MPSTRQLCPACSHRETRIIDPHCIVCDGIGVLHLGDAALTIYPPEVVGEAVDLTLEAAARIGDTAGTLSDDRLEPLRNALLALRDSGVLDPECTTLTSALANKTSAAHPAKAIAEEILQVPLVPLDMVLPHADPYEYSDTDRPGQRGLPLLSRNGHPSHLARVTDPRDPYMDTAADVRRRRRKKHSARVLSEAAELSLWIPRRRTRKPPAGHPELPLAFPHETNTPNTRMELAAA